MSSLRQLYQAVEPVPPLLPVGENASQQAIVRRSVVELGDMAEFVQDDVIDAVLGCLSQARVEREAASARAAAPVSTHAAEPELTRVLNAEVCGAFKAGRHTFIENPLSTLAEPPIEDLLCPFGSLDRKEQLATGHFHTFDLSGLYPQAMLPSQIPPRLPTHVLTWRERRRERGKLALLAENPGSAFLDTLPYFKLRRVQWGDDTHGAIGENLNAEGGPLTAQDQERDP